jgi:hypothetical protein
MEKITNLKEYLRSDLFKEQGRRYAYFSVHTGKYASVDINYFTPIDIDRCKDDESARKYGKELLEGFKNNHPESEGQLLFACVAYGNLSSSITLAI